jgi:hypothetical protein
MQSCSQPFCFLLLCSPKRLKAKAGDNAPVVVEVAVVSNRRRPRQPRHPQTGGGQTGQRPQGAPTPTPEEPPVVTHHSITVGGRELKYTATTGMMPIKNRDGETEARMFFRGLHARRR